MLIGFVAYSQKEPVEPGPPIVPGLPIDGGLSFLIISSPFYSIFCLSKAPAYDFIIY